MEAQHALTPARCGQPDAPSTPPRPERIIATDHGVIVVGTTDPDQRRSRQCPLQRLCVSNGNDAVVFSMDDNDWYSAALESLQPPFIVKQVSTKHKANAPTTGYGGNRSKRALQDHTAQTSLRCQVDRWARSQGESMCHNVDVGGGYVVIKDTDDRRRQCRLTGLDQSRCAASVSGVIPQDQSHPTPFDVALDQTLTYSVDGLRIAITVENCGSIR